PSPRDSQPVTVPTRTSPVDGGVATSDDDRDLLHAIPGASPIGRKLVAMGIAFVIVVVTGVSVVSWVDHARTSQSTTVTPRPSTPTTGREIPLPPVSTPAAVVSTAPTVSATAEAPDAY